MNVTRAILAALRGDPEVVKEFLRERIDVEGPMSTVIQGAEALTPIIERAVRRRPSKLGELSLKSAHLLAGLAAEDRSTNETMARVAKGHTVGIVFADVAGFTTFTAEKGDGAAIELLTKLGKIIEKSTRANKGEVVKRLGDGFLLAFPSASQAVRAAAGVQAAVRTARAKNSAMRLRVAVHAGEPLMEGNDLLGHDVNLTARLLDHCKPGQVIVSETAKELAERRLKQVKFNKKRVIKIRGLSTRVTAYEVLPDESTSAEKTRTRSETRSRAAALSP